MVVRDLHRDSHARTARDELLAELEANDYRGTTIGRTRIRNIRWAPPAPVYLPSSEDDSDSEIYK